MNTYNPMLDYQRNQLLAQQSMIQNQLNQLNQRSFNPYPQSEPFQIKQVGSIEEVKGFPVEPSIMYLFPDTGTGYIYLKKLNTDNGKSEIITYRPENSEKHTDPVIERLDSIDKHIGAVYESISSIKVSTEPTGSNATADAGEDAKVKPSKVRTDSAND